MHIVDYGVGSLKRGRCPPKSATPIASGSSSLLMVSSSPDVPSNQVNPSVHCLVGVPRGKGSNAIEVSQSVTISLVPDVPVASTMKGVRREVCREKGKVGLVEGEGLEGIFAGEPGRSISTAAVESSRLLPSTAALVPIRGSREITLTLPPMSRNSGGDLKGGKVTVPATLGKAWLASGSEWTLALE